MKPDTTTGRLAETPNNNTAGTAINPRTTEPDNEYIIVNLDEAYRRIWEYSFEYVMPCVMQARIHRYAIQN